MTLDEMADAFGNPWFDYQLEAFEGERGVDASELRACLYYRTGAGKTSTALAMLKLAGCDRATVIAPPKTHAQWHYAAALIGMQLNCISHAKYRMKGTKFSRLEPIIVDEFHMLGGQSADGWSKLRIQARHMLAPLLILSATPNYNDAERVYCVQYVLDPLPNQGGYIAWIYRNCATEENPFGSMPEVLGFLDGRPAKAHLADLPHVYYVEDPHEDFPIAEVNIHVPLPDEFEDYGINRRTQRIMASMMEERVSTRFYQYIDDDGFLRASVYNELIEIAGNSATPLMVFCATSTIATAAMNMAQRHNVRAGLVVGATPAKAAERQLRAFRYGKLDVLFGTATMSTGVDGLDRICDTLVLLDDTDDDSLRRQVIGRILPRGASVDVSKKLVVRITIAS